MFSHRTGWNLTANRLQAALDERRRADREIFDLTISNPTRAGIPYPAEEIADALARSGECASDPARSQGLVYGASRGAATHFYAPDPKGDKRAREAIAAWYAERGLGVDPGSIVLTASTSEAYSWVFKLLCDPGDRVLVPRPSYPLFEFLASLESVSVEGYPLRYDGRWELDREVFASLLGTSIATPATPPDRAIVLVNPNNPTGSFLSRTDLSFLVEAAGAHGVSLISDEVFSSYPLAASCTTDTGPPSALHNDAIPPRSCSQTSAGAGRANPEGAGPGADPPSGSAAVNGSASRITSSHELTQSLLPYNEVPAFVLDGLSKSAGLPGMKAGWIVVLGPPTFRESALARLEMIADTYLSVSAPVQRALPRLIELGKTVSSAIRQRTAANLAALREMIRPPSPCEVLNLEGGWSAVLRIPRTRSEEGFCLSLLEEDGVLVQPGWFFDFEQEAFLVLSLLTPEKTFRHGIAQILTRSD